MTSTTALDKNSSKTGDSEAHHLSTKIWSVLASDLQNPDSKHYAQSVLKRAMEKLNNDKK
jgi:hypothetical protein